jgi:hypothetical protein
MNSNNTLVRIHFRSSVRDRHFRAANLFVINDPTDSGRVLNGRQDRQEPDRPRRLASDAQKV